MNNLIFICLVMVGATIITSTHASPVYPQSLKATNAIKRFPGAATLGSTIEGASCDARGNVYAVNQTHFINLAQANPKPIAVGNGGKESFFASSRFTHKYGALLGDAVKHDVRSADGKILFTEPQMLQPNDMTITADESRLYLSGMNYTANTGDLWYVDLASMKTHGCALPRGKQQIFRTNGIELSPDDSTLYITSSQNSADGTAVVSTKIWRFDVDKLTGVPSNPRVALDLTSTLAAMGLNSTEAGMDPDGMRMDSHGFLFITLNAFQRVLVWDTRSSLCSSSTATVWIIDLPTVKFPSNLEFGGPDGKDLVIVGRCKDSKSSCVDTYKHVCPGRAFTNLNKRK